MNNKIKSTEQLSIDFGHFPPHPINEFKLNSTFEVRHIGKLRFISYNLFLFIRVFLNLDFYRDNTSMESNSVTAEIINSFYKSKNEISNLKKEYKKKNLISKVLILFIILVLSPFIILGFFITLLKVTRPLKRLYFRASGSVNYFDLNNNFVFIHKHSENLDNDPIITHEHIHILQNEHQNKKIQKTKKLMLNSRVDWFNKLDDILVTDLEYWLEADELEARLHELVLSGYRKYNKLPITNNEFLEFIMRNEDVSRSFYKYEDLMVSILKTGFSDKYTTRFKNVGLELYYILFFLPSDTTRLSFISGVLYPMYGNLVNYYGDDVLSKKIFMGIEGPTLHNYMYK